MFNIIDLVQMKTKRKREDVEEILSAAIAATTENLTKGNDVYWIGLCKFTYKQKAKTLKQAKEWTEFPYLAEGSVVRAVPEIENVEIKGSVTKIEKPQNGKDESKV